MTKQNDTIELYFWPTPNGWKIAVMLEELGIPYNVNWVNIGKGDQFKPDFLAISPNNRMPAIIDPNGPEGKSVSVFESGAILQYLGRKFDKFYPKDERSRIQVEEWLMWQMGGLGPMAGQAHHFALYAQEKIPYAIKRYFDECTRLYGVLEKRLEGREYVVDEFSIADIAIVSWILRYERHGQKLTDYQNIAGWYARMLQRSGVSKGLQLGLDEQAKMDFATNSEAQKNLFGAKS